MEFSDVVALKIKELMQEKLEIKLSLSEQTYLTIHIQRLIKFLTLKPKR